MDNQKTSNIQTDQQQQTVSVNSGLDQLPNKEKPISAINIIISLIFVVIVLIEWFYPAPENYDSLRADFIEILSPLLEIFGVVAGFNFLNITVKLSKEVSPNKRVIRIIVGILGGVFIAVLQLILAMIFVNRATGPHAGTLF